MLVCVSTECAHRFSNEELIEKLRRLFQQHGYLSGLIIDEAEGMPLAAACWPCTDLSCAVARE
jgi:hypothetical protein